MWALFLLSAVVFAWVQVIDGQIEGMRQSNFGLEARALAHSGINVALHPLVTRLTPQLRQGDDERGYTATIVGEGGKLNLSYLLAGEDPVRLTLLKQYLELRGLSFKDREVFVDCLLDWVGPPGTRHANGVKESADYKPSHRPFTSLDEIPLVAGSAPLIAAWPGWRDDLTLWSQGPLDLEAAPEELIALVPGIGELKAEQFVRQRQGSDREDGTEDDVDFGNLEGALNFMGLTTPQQREALQGLVTYRDPTVRIVCEGTVVDVNKRVEVIARKQQGQNPQILLWIEK